MTGDRYREWIGRVDERQDRLSPAVANMMRAALSDAGQPTVDVRDGEVLPPLWHWAAFHPTEALSELGAEGHPKRGGFLPDVPLERRMWAGGRLTFHRPLHIGETIRRRSEILKIEEKSGGAGPMVFVTVGHDVHGEAGLAVSEEQDIVYIAMPESYRPPKPIPAPEKPDVDIKVSVDPVRLFRYSAATFNGHRIHYDLAYTTEVEKYPALVVHGPLQATLLMGIAVSHRGRAPASFDYRGVHPMFDNEPMRLVGLARDEDGMELCTAAPAGHQGLQARARWT